MSYLSQRPYRVFLPKTVSDLAAKRGVEISRHPEGYYIITEPIARTVCNLRLRLTNSGTAASACHLIRRYARYRASLSPEARAQRQRLGATVGPYELADWRLLS